MNMQTVVKDAAATRLLVKPGSADAPALVWLDDTRIAVRAGVRFAGYTFEQAAPVEIAAALIPGADYGVIIDRGVPRALRADLGPPVGDNVIGGFHFAPGRNASARSGGDNVPAINPHSIWDVNFRPACADPRGMARAVADGKPFWFDIYLLGINHHAEGTSRFNVTIADGVSRPIDPASGKPHAKLDYKTAVAVLAHHGKQVPSHAEFIALSHGVTERTAHSGDPVVTKWDVPRVSQRGANQATGNLWQWGHDGDPDTPRASFFGGSWWGGGGAGSRCASVGSWAGNSSENFGARGRSDHLQLG